MNNHQNITAHTFWVAGHIITKHNMEGSIQEGLRRFRALFGCTCVVCAWMWNYWVHRNVLPSAARPIHLLYALLVLKVYAIEEVNKSMTGVDEKTFRKWVWIFVDLMAFQLPAVSKQMCF